MILLAILVFGLLAGWLANIILGGGSRPDNWGRLLVAGLVGSFVGGMAGSLIIDGDLEIHPSGLVGSILGAVVVLAILKALDKRS